MNKPAGLPEQIWVVIRPSGERDFLVKEPLEGIDAWAKGLNATIVKYRFDSVVHLPPQKK